MENNCFYSSEDELAWGPLTLSEIKNEFHNEPRRIIHRRETDFGHSTFFTPSTTFCDDKNEPSDKVNSSSGTSAYFTPNESLSQPQQPALSRNDLFLKNLNAAIESDHNTETEVDVLNAKRDTLLNILEGQRGRESDLLEGVQQTLVENTFQQLEDTIAEDNIKISQESSDCDIIIISDDSSSNESDEEVEYEPITACVKMEHEYDESDLLQVSEKSTSTHDSEEEVNVSECSAGRNISDRELKNQDSIIIIKENFDRTNEMNLNDHVLNISGVSHFSQSDGSNEYKLDELPNVNHDEENECRDSDEFNDTIEEMERALRQGLDYIMPEDNSVESLHTSEPKPTGIPKFKKLPRTPNTFDYVHSPIGDYIRKKSPNRENFKLPLKPAKSKFVTPNAKLNVAQTKQFKNIISPVGVYIKNSPRVVLKQNLQVKTVPTLISPTKANVIKSNNDNIVIPEVVYKPGKKVVTSVKKDVILPSSLQRMVQEPIIIQHECRTGGKTRSEIAKKLEDGDLTVDSSLLNESDVSYINVKQAFIK